MSGRSSLQTYTSLAPKWYMGEDRHIEITFYGKHCGVVKKINWTYWHDQIDNCLFLMSEDEQELSIVRQRYIQHFWRLFGGDLGERVSFKFIRMRVVKRYECAI